MGVPMIPVIVVIACKTVAGAPLDDVAANNAAFTKHENRQWAYENSMMVCKREEIQVEDSAAMMGADPQSFNEQRCMASAIKLGVDWDKAHESSAYRAWRVACPTRVIDTRTGETIDWVLPDCGHRDTVICERDSVI